MPRFTGLSEVPSMALDSAILRYFDLPPRNWQDQLEWLHQGFGSWSYVATFADVSEQTLYKWRRTSPPLFRQLDIDRSIRNWFVTQPDILLTLTSVPLYFRGILQWSDDQKTYREDMLPTRIYFAEAERIATAWLEEDKDIYVKLGESLARLFSAQHNSATIKGKCEFKLGGNFL